MSESSKIRWKTIAAESVAIVLSILFAFAIDAWWDERKEREFEQDALASLKSEYEEHRRTIEKQIEFHRTSLQSIAALMLACQQGTFDSSAHSFDDSLWYFWVPLTTDLGTGARDALISAGHIEVLEDRQLRYEFSEWDSVLGEVVDDQIFSRDLVRELVIPYLVRHGISMSAAADGKDGMPWPVPTRSLTTDAEAMKRLFADAEFCAILDARYSMMDHTRAEYGELLDAINKILDRIEDSMDGSI